MYYFLLESRPESIKAFSWFAQVIECQPVWSWFFSHVRDCISAQHANYFYVDTEFFLDFSLQGSLKHIVR